MAAPLSARKFRLELEFTVTFDEIGEQHLTANHPPQLLPYLQQLQQALLADDRLLLQQIQMRLAGLLQEYADTLVEQNPLLPLRQAEAALDQEGLTSLQDPDLDFCQLTYPLRHTCLNAQLTGSQLSEETPQPEAKPHWEPVWTDLSLQSPVGRWLHLRKRRLAWLVSPRQASQHYFLIRSLFNLKGRVQVEASCTCGLSFLGTGDDEGQALASAWAGYDQHLQAYRLAGLTARSGTALQEN